MDRLTRSLTNIIAALTALAWLVALLAGASETAAQAFGFIPVRVAGVPVPWPATPWFVTPLTATLVHSGLIHLGFNLVVFLWCGNQVERVIGKGGLAILYLVGAYAAAALQWAADPAGTTPMVGASGAISAVMGAYALSFGRAKRVTKSATINRWINVAWLLAAWIVLQMMMGFIAGTEGFLLATPAHIGGFIAGLLLQRPLLLWRYRKA